MKSWRLVMLCLLLLLPACRGGGGGSESAPVPEASPVQVSVTPAEGSRGVPLESRVDILFTGDMDVSSLNSSNLILARGQFKDGYDPDYQQLPAEIIVEARRATIIPRSELETDALHTVRIGQGVRDAEGRVLGVDIEVRFFTVDILALGVDAFSPSDGAENYHLDQPLIVEFNDDLDPASVEEGAIRLTLEGSEESLVGSLALGERTLTFTPDHALEPNARYQFTVSGSLRDEAGNPLGEERIIRFATRDTIAPYLVSSDPEDLAERVATNLTPISLQFSEQLIPGTVNPTSVEFLRQKNGAPVLNEIIHHEGDFLVELVPDQFFFPGEDFLIRIDGEVKDRFFNPLGEDIEIQFSSDLWTEPFPVGLPEGGSILEYDVAFRENGEILAVWTQQGQGEDYRNLHSRRFFHDGDGWQEETTRISLDVTSVQSIRLAVRDNHVFVVWREKVAEMFFNVFVAEGSFAADGPMSWSEPVLLSSDTAQATEPDVAIRENGVGVVVWLEKAAIPDAEDDYKNVYVSMQNPSGGQWGASARLTEDLGNCQKPTLSAVPNHSHVFLTWIEKVNGVDSNNNVYSMRHNGNRWTGRSRNSSDATGAQELALFSLAWDDSALAFLAWKEGNSSFVSIFNGSVWDEPFEFDTYSRKMQFAAAATNPARVYLCWENIQMSEGRVFLSWLDISGWQPKILVSTDGLDAENPGLAVDEEGNALVSFVEEGLARASYLGDIREDRNLGATLGGNSLAVKNGSVANLADPLNGVFFLQQDSVNQLYAVLFRPSLP